MSEKQFELKIDGDSMTYGDYLDLVGGSPLDQANVFAGYVAVDGELVGKEAGLKYLRSLKMSELQELMESVKNEIVGDNSPN